MSAHKHIVHHAGHVTAEDRARLLRQHPVTVWLTGLSGAGKSTLAYALEARLVGKGYACYVLDGDNVRHGINRDLGFTHADRTENIRRIAEIAKLMNDAGLIVITAFISPYLADRTLAKSTIGQENFIEVYLSTPLPVCEKRDPKGFYQRARAGEIAGYTGVASPYEPPVSARITLDTSTLGVETCVETVLAAILPTMAYITPT